MSDDLTVLSSELDSFDRKLDVLELAILRGENSQLRQQAQKVAAQQSKNAQQEQMRQKLQSSGKYSL